MFIRYDHPHHLFIRKRTLQVFFYRQTIWWRRGVSTSVDLGAKRSGRLIKYLEIENMHF